MRYALCLGVALLASCATRAVSDNVPRRSPLSLEAPAAPLAAPAVALTEEPPLPDEPSPSALWSGLEDRDAAVFPLPSEPGASWSAQPAAPQSDAPQEAHGGHYHAR
jgi:hypothetical protein